ncbi:MAG: PAS domain S-box protein [Bacteroidales bacterium]|nr:PAS domain S-box protein [Bacteroidales bacterium]MCB8998855.1 PAS domain S-box protein [Bacteroidales bacterium]MCB9014006.1 PAS domain S-box protein [Bacteroidales bacterium]
MDSLTPKNHTVSEIDFSEIINSLSEGIIITTKEGIVLSTNNSFERIFGLSKGEILGKNILEVADSGFSSENLKKLKTIFYRFGKGVTAKKIQLEYMDKVLEINPSIYSNSSLFSIIVRDISREISAEKSLRSSMELYKSIMSASPDGIVVTDVKGNIELASPATLSLLKLLKEEEIIGRNIQDFLADEYKDIAAVHLKQIIADIKIGPQNYKLVNQDDIVLDVEIKSAKVYNPDGSSKGFVFAIRDVTERKLAEELFILSEKRQKSILEMAMDGFFIADLDGNLLEVNKKYCEITGYEADELLGMNLSVLEVEEVNFDTIKIKGEERIERIYRCKDGFLIEVEISMQYHNEFGDRIVAFVHDITERKKAHSEREQSNRLMNYIIEHSPRSIAVLDKDLKYIFNSQRYLKDFKLKQQNISGLHCYELFKNLPKKWKEAYDNALKGQIYTAFDDPYVQEDGTIDWIKWECRPWFDHNNKIGGIIVYSEIITESKKAQQEILRAKEKAEESDKLKTFFLANMSHEIRTPMNGILGFTGLLKDPKLTGENQQRYISIIEKSGARMLNIINDIINISKIEAGQIELVLIETNVNELMEYLLNFFKPEVEQKGLSINLKCGLSNPESIVKTDKEKLSVILSNLLKNAIKFTNTGSIDFGYIRKGNYLEFYVRDTGIGIPEEQRGIIFKRFRQGSESLTRKYEGAGLGLSISKAYAEILDSKLWLESEEGKGTVFYLSLPYFNEDAEKLSFRVKVPSEKPGMVSKDLKMIIAEDDETSGMYIELVVEDYCRELLRVKNGHEAIESLKKNPDTDLILMDINMPEMNGYDATREIRKFNQGVVIIAQTAYTMENEKEKALEAGCSDYLPKPFTKSKLLEMLNKHFE